MQFNVGSSGCDEIDFLFRAINVLATHELRREAFAVGTCIQSVQQVDYLKLEAMLHVFRNSLIAARHKQVWLHVWNECRRLAYAHQHAFQAEAFSANEIDR